MSGAAPLVMRLPYPISANVYWRHRVVVPKPGEDGKAADPFVQTYVSPEAKAFKEEVGWRAKSYGVRQPLQGRLRMHIQLFPHLPKDWQTRARKDPEWWDDTVRCIDLGNCEKVLSDALNGVVIGDDNQFWRITLDRMPPAEEAHIIVSIEQVPRSIREQVQQGFDLSPVVDERYVPPADGLPF